MGTTDRREFLRKTALAGTTVAAGFSGNSLSPHRIFAQETQETNNIVYRNLGSTGYEVSQIGFGAMNTRDAELIFAAIDSGINYIDTAHAYMKGENEKIVGSVMKTKRKKVFLATKMPWKNRSAKQIREMMELSLKRLQTDYVDIIFLHNVGSGDTVLDENLISLFEKAKKDGLCRFAGISTHKNQAEILNTAVKSKFWDSVLLGYNYKSPPELTTSIERARKAGLAIIAMKTLVNGTGYPEHNMGNITANQAAIKWVLQDRFVDTAILGMTSFEHLTEDLSVMGMKMSQSRSMIQGSKVAYCSGVAGCTGCIGKCPKGVEVSEINRCLGYLYGYNDYDLAWENYKELPESSHVYRCMDCTECAVKCINGLDLTENIKRAKELFA